jgi:hypothetical protein
MRCSLRFSAILLFILQGVSLHASPTSLEDLFSETIKRTQFEMRFFDLVACVDNANSDFNVTLECPDDIQVVRAAKLVGVKRWSIDEDAGVVTSYWNYYTAQHVPRAAKIILTRKTKKGLEEEKD